MLNSLCLAQFCTLRNECGLPLLGYTTATLPLLGYTTAHSFTSPFVRLYTSCFSAQEYMPKTAVRKSSEVGLDSDSTVFTNPEFKFEDLTIEIKVII